MRPGGGSGISDAVGAGASVTGALFGREPELRAVASFLERAAAGRAALLIEGDAGAGKTALWLEAIATAEARSFRVLSARPGEQEARLAFAALTDLLGACFEEVRFSLPEPQETALAAALAVAEANEPARLRVTSTAVVSALGTLAAVRPLLVAIDDAQWLDRASARVLEFAARRLPARVGLLVTRRGAAEPVPLALDRTLPDVGLERIVPGPLSLAALHHLLASRLGVPPPRPVLRRLARTSGGNPLFALELGRALGRGRSGGPGEPLPVPGSLRELVASRLVALSDPAREAALAGAALARPTAAAVLRALGDRRDPERALEEAEEADVLVVRDGRVEFTHPLLASAVYGSVSAAARRRLHRRLAGIVADAEERARHLALTVTRPDAAIADELERAARGAALRGAPDAAAELFAAAVHLTPAGLDDARAARLTGQGAALNSAGEFAGARAAGETALEQARAPRVRVETLTLLARIAWFRGETGAACELVEQALVEAAGDRALAGPLLARLVRYSFAHDLARARERAERAAELLDGVRERGRLAHVLIDLHFASALLGLRPPPGVLERGLELEATEFAGYADSLQPMPLIWWHCIDDYDSARARHALEERWYRERGEELWVADRRSHLAVAELHAGAWDLAERSVEESCAAIEGLGVGGPLAMMLEKRSLVDAHRGRVERARSTLSPLLQRCEREGQRWWAALALSALAFTEFAAGDDRAAVGALGRMREHAAAALGPNGDVLFDRSEPFHVEALLSLGELGQARTVLARLERRGRTLPRRWIDVALPRTRALLLAAEGDLAGALVAVREVDATAAAALPFEHAWTLLVRGRLERRARQRTKAAESLGGALAIFERLGAPAFAERARGELARVGLRHAPGVLTPSERRIAELAASGLTNREVAEVAFVSPKTVEANLARVYRKLGIRSRAELGARMAAVRGEAQT